MTWPLSSTFLSPLGLTGSLTDVSLSWYYWLWCKLCVHIVGLPLFFDSGQTGETLHFAELLVSKISENINRDSYHSNQKTGTPQSSLTFVLLPGFQMCLVRELYHTVCRTVQTLIRRLMAAIWYNGRSALFPGHFCLNFWYPKNSDRNTQETVKTQIRIQKTLKWYSSICTWPWPTLSPCNYGYLVSRINVFLEAMKMCQQMIFTWIKWASTRCGFISLINTLCLWQLKSSGVTIVM